MIISCFCGIPKEWAENYYFSLKLLRCLLPIRLLLLHSFCILLLIKLFSFFETSHVHFHLHLLHLLLIVFAGRIPFLHLHLLFILLLRHLLLVLLFFHAVVVGFVPVILLALGLLVHVNLIFQLHSVARDVDLVWLRDHLVAQYARLAVQAAEVFQISLQLVHHDVLELAKVVYVPITVHRLRLLQVILYQVNLRKL